MGKKYIIFEGLLLDISKMLVFVWEQLGMSELQKFGGINQCDGKFSLFC